MSRERLIAIVAMIKATDLSSASELASEVTWPPSTGRAAAEDPAESPNRGVAGGVFDGPVTNAAPPRPDTLEGSSAEVVSLEIPADLIAEFERQGAAPGSKREPALKEDAVVGLAATVTTAPDRSSQDVRPSAFATLEARLVKSGLNLKVVRRTATTDAELDALTWPMPPAQVHSYLDLIEGRETREQLAADGRERYRQMYALFRDWSEERGIKLHGPPAMAWLFLLSIGHDGVAMSQDDASGLHGLILPAGDNSGDIIQIVSTWPGAEYPLFPIRS